MKEIKNSFELVQGGNKEPVLSREQRRKQIAEDASKNDLTKDEKNDLRQRRTRELLLDLKFSIFQHCKRLIRDKEAAFIRDHFLVIAIGDDKEREKAMEVLNRKFPYLKDYFEDILAKIKEAEQE